MVIWSILGLLALFGIIAIIVRIRKGKQPTDYYAFFQMGIIFLPIGIVLSLTLDNFSMVNVFTIIGIIYLIIGLSHKKEWKKNQKASKKKKK